jgi:hypothetical protein
VTSIPTKGKLSTALWTLRRIAAIPSSADCLNEQNRTRHTPPQNIDCRDFIGKRSILSCDHLEIAGDANQSVTKQLLGVSAVLRSKMH